MRITGAHGREDERGQASVELLGVLPAALLIVAIGWQLLLAGQAIWLAGNAARVAARAKAVGRDPAPAARGALPSYLNRGLRVMDRDGDGVRIRLRVPLAVPGVRSPLTVRADAAMQSQGEAAP
jgi:hypothetical protein